MARIILEDLPDLQGQIKELNDYMKEVESAKGLIQSVHFLGVKEVSELFGCNIQTARELFNRPDFPCDRIGREKQVEVHAFIEYFGLEKSVQRRGLT